MVKEIKKGGTEMIKRVLIAVLLAGMVPGIASSGEPSRVVGSFVKTFQARNLNSAEKFLSKLDYDYLKQLNARFQAAYQRMGMQHQPFTMKDLLERSWRAINDPEQKRKTLERMKTVFDKHPANLQNAEELKRKVEVLLKIAPDSVYIPFSGKVIKEEVAGSYAVVVGDAYIEYPSKVLKEAKRFYGEMNKNVNKERGKYIRWEKNRYHFPVVFYLVKEGPQWKVVYFNRAAFPRDKFQKLLDVFEPQRTGPSAAHSPMK